MSTHDVNFKYDILNETGAMELVIFNFQQMVPLTFSFYYILRAYVNLFPIIYVFIFLDDLTNPLLLKIKILVSYLR